MRKFYLFMAAVFCAATTFTGCSDDDGGNDGSGGNGQGAGNGGSGVVVLAKKVAKVSVLNDEGEVSETYLFNYDQEGRVSKIINQYGPGGGYQEEKTFSYGDNKITITEDDEESVITLKDGKAVSYTEKDGNYEDTYSFTYSGNYLYQVENVEKHLSNGNWSVDYERKTVICLLLRMFGRKKRKGRKQQQVFSNMEMWLIMQILTWDLFVMIWMPRNCMFCVYWEPVIRICRLLCPLVMVDGLMM